MSQTESSVLDVRLENFEGPLDLLLHLIRKNDLEISDIPIAQITQEYLSYLSVMKDLNLEVAGEFLVMASMLMQIKAQMLLPSSEVEGDEGPDPRTELINKLLEYQKFKEASNYLATAHDRAKDVYYRSIPPAFGEDDFTLRASVIDLMEAFKRVLEEAPKEISQVLRDEIPLEVKIREILDRLEVNSSVAFEDLFHSATSRREMVVTFLALLELIRLKQVVARQQELFASIRLYRIDAAEIAEPPVEETAEAVILEEPAPQPLEASVATTEPIDSPVAEPNVPLTDLPLEQLVSPAEVVIEPEPVTALSPESIVPTAPETEASEAAVATEIAVEPEPIASAVPESIVAPAPESEAQGAAIEQAIDQLTEQPVEQMAEPSPEPVEPVAEQPIEAAPEPIITTTAEPDALPAESTPESEPKVEENTHGTE